MKVQETLVSGRWVVAGTPRPTLTLPNVSIQTIPGIMEKTYTIMASTEGEYHITYIADAFCSYPPNAQSGTGHAGQKLITM